MVFDAGILEHIGYNPISKELITGVELACCRILDIQFSKNRVQTGETIFIMTDKSLGSVFPKTIEEIDHKQETGAIVRTILSDITAPVI